MTGDNFIILLYHGVDSGESFYKEMAGRPKEYILKKDLFERHMEYLYKNCFKAIPLGECLARAKNGTLSDKAVVLTFDDGEESCFRTVAPVLDAFNFKGEFFIITSRIGKRGYMTGEEIRAMANSGHSIQSHSVSHPFLTEHGDKGISEELTLSKNKMSVVSGRSVEFFSIPTGSYDRRVIDAAKMAGYRAVLSSVEGYNTAADGLYFLNRFAMRSYTSVKALKDICEKKTLTKGKLLAKKMVTAPLKHVLTFDLYNRIRDRVIHASFNREG